MGAAERELRELRHLDPEVLRDRGVAPVAHAEVQELAGHRAPLVVRAELLDAAAEAVALRERQPREG